MDVDAAHRLAADRAFCDVLALDLGDERPRREDESPNRCVLAALGDALEAGNGLLDLVEEHAKWF